MITVKQMKEDIYNLPPFKETVLRARARLTDPASSAAEIAEILQYDAGITANILRLCNSPYFGFRGEIRNLCQAVAYLGNNELHEVLIVSGSMDYFRGWRKGYEGGYGELWRHSIATAVLARQLGEQFAGGEKHYFVAGLLHDVGKLILSKYVSNQYQAILDCIREEEITFHQAEKRILGMHHAEVGALLLQHWSFPDHIVAAAATHHSREVQGCSETELIVALADRFSAVMGTGTLTDSMQSPGVEKLCRYFGLQGDDVEHLLSGAVQEVGDIIQTFSLEPAD